MLLPTSPITCIQVRLLCTSYTDPPFKDKDSLIVEQNGQTTLIYPNLSHIDHTQEYLASTTFPYGWSAVAEDFHIHSNFHPNCLNPDALSIVEAEFVDEALTNPEQDEALDDHIGIIHSHTSGQQLQWLSSSLTSTHDHIGKRLALIDLHANVDKHEGHIYHSEKGLRITIPEEKWTTWRTLSPSSQDEFTKVAWAQMTQFDKEVMMTTLSQGKLGDKPIYIDFSQEAEHDTCWNTEFKSIRHYVVNLATEYQAYPIYNPYVISDLATTKPLSGYTPWNYERPTYVHLPYSQCNLQWNSDAQRWEHFIDSDNSNTSMSEDDSAPPPSMISCSSPDESPFTLKAPLQCMPHQKAYPNPAFQPIAPTNEIDPFEEGCCYLAQQKFLQDHATYSSSCSSIAYSPIDQFEQEGSSISLD